MTPQEEGFNAKRAVKGNFHACCHGTQRQPEERCHHGHCQKTFGLAHADLLYHKTNNIILLLSTPMALIYNHELGVFNSSEFFSCKKPPEEGLHTPKYLYFFS